jgi:hypothetical protein
MNQNSRVLAAGTRMAWAGARARYAGYAIGGFVALIADRRLLEGGPK